MKQQRIGGGGAVADSSLRPVPFRSVSPAGPPFGRRKVDGGGENEVGFSAIFFDFYKFLIFKFNRLFVSIFFALACADWLCSV